VARAWIKAGSELVDLWDKVDKFFQKRKDLRRPKKTILLDQQMAIGSDEARTLVFELGGKLGFDALSCERLIDIVGNPISTLKFLVAVGREGRKIATLDSNGLIKLPDTPEQPISLPRSANQRQRRRAGVEVQVIKRRRQAKPRDQS